MRGRVLWRFVSWAVRKARHWVAACGASVVIVGADFPTAENQQKCLLTVADPARWFVRAMSALFPADPETFVHADAVIEEGAVIGAGSHIDAGVYIGSSVQLGRNCRIGPNSSLGVSGLAVEYDEDNLPLPYPHLGSLIVGDGVCIGANSVVVRGILEPTRIGDNCQIGNMVNIGHNCSVGANCWISTGAVLCGSASLGLRVMVGASATINNHVSIGDGATVGLGSVVTKSVTPGKRVFGVPAKSLATMRKL